VCTLEEISCAVWSLDLYQCCVHRLGKDRTNSCLTSQRIMLSKRLKCVIAGLLVGLPLLLLVSGSAVACGRAHDRHALAVDGKAVRTIGAVASLVRGYAPMTRRPVRKAAPRAASLNQVMVLPPASATDSLRRDGPIAKTLLREAASRTASVVREPVHEVLPSASRGKTELASSLLSSKSCTRALGCSCCSANAGCCGMACCAVALPASVPMWPNPRGHAWDEPVFQRAHPANSDTLFRPPCASV